MTQQSGAQSALRRTVDATVARAHEPEPHANLADYDVVEPIGTGGMDAVYRARDILPMRDKSRAYSRS